jgi:hypothetical protein
MNEHFDDSVQDQIYEEAWEYTVIRDFEELLDTKGINYVKQLMTEDHSKLLL